MIVYGGGGAPVEEECGRCESFSPVRRRHGGVEEHGADGVVYGAEHTFGLAVLRGCVRAREAEQDAMAGEKGVDGVVNKLRPIICLECFGLGAKLCLSVSNELDKMAMDFRFVTQWKCPAIMCKIINEDKIVFETRVAKHRRSPHITMY